MDPRNQPTRARRGVFILLVAFSTLWLEIPDAIAYHIVTWTVRAMDEWELKPKPSNSTLKKTFFRQGSKFYQRQSVDVCALPTTKPGNPRGELLHNFLGMPLATSNP
jgi:hypothetical protein